MQPIYADADKLASILSDAEAIEELEKALAGNVNPEQDADRIFSPAPHGEFLLMPSSGIEYSGVKLATIAPRNPQNGMPKIQGIYVLFDSQTLAPVAIMDGAELTLIRTPATTAVAVKHILAATERHDDAGNLAGIMVVFGTGPQAWRHIKALRSVVPSHTTIVVGRDKKKAEQFAQYCRAQGVTAQAGNVSSVAAADLVICASSSPTPLFDDDLLQPHAVVAAVGSHGLEAREIDPRLARRADIVVESRISAMKEAGDLIPARSAKDWQNEPLTNLAELVSGAFTRTPGRPTLYTGAGMAWQDLVIASAVYARLR